VTVLHLPGEEPSLIWPPSWPDRAAWLDSGMGWLGWIVTFLVLGLLALGLLALLGLRLWRASKALGRDLARASSQLADLGYSKDPSRAP
jgi:hypothetical protein